MSIDLKRLESAEIIPGYHDAIYQRSPNAWEIINAQVGVELSKIGSTQFGEVQALKARIGEDIVQERARQQLAVQYASNPHLLRIWQHEQDNIAGTRTRGAMTIG